MVRRVVGPQKTLTSISDLLLRRLSRVNSLESVKHLQVAISVKLELGTYLIGEHITEGQRGRDKQTALPDPSAPLPPDTTSTTL